MITKRIIPCLDVRSEMCIRDRNTPGCAHCVRKVPHPPAGRTGAGWCKKNRGEPTWNLIFRRCSPRSVPPLPYGRCTRPQGAASTTWAVSYTHLDVYKRQTQWGDNFPPQELLEEDIDSNRLFVYVVNGQLLGVFAFILGVDPTYQVIEGGAWLNDTLPYGTIHRLASSGKSKGVASAVIEWCLEHCQSLRADTHADNQIMQHLLEKNGFTRCGIIHVADGTPRIAYQKLALTQQHS